jgi:hypothetical protein
MDAELASMERAFGFFARPATYQRGADAHPIRAHARGLRADELVAAADQFDRYVIILASELEGAGLSPPRRFDRVQLGDGVFVVFDHRPSPAIGKASFLKLMVKGGAA